MFITGGAGFIGSHLSEKLIAKGHHVRVLDDLSTGKNDNVKNLVANPHFEAHWDTIFNDALLESLIKKSDIVIHFAAAVGVKLIVDSPVKTIETNISGTDRVLKYCAKYKRRCYIASTSEVYGKNKNIPFSEGHDLVLGPTSKSRWSYACSKAIDEFLAIAYYHEKDTPTMIFRFFNTVGPRQVGQYGMVIPRFVEQALRGEALTVYGDGSQSRCFCLVDDVVEAIDGLVESDDHYGEIFNIGSQEEITIMDLAKKIIMLTKSSSVIEKIPLNKVYGEGFEDMQRRVPDLSKIHGCIGFQPKYNLESTLKKIIQYFQNT
ncbi:GDP-mannose 4,6-dehydratase [PVC group bacterium]|nr:GDP-mannose 4,6-dehydratase [PVC group bacterium]